MTKRSNTTKRRFWIPAVIGAMALLTAVSMLAPKVLTSVLAADDGTSVSQSDAGGETNGETGNVSESDHRGGQGDGQGEETVSSSDIPSDITQYPVAVFNFNDGDVDTRLSLELSGTDDVYFGFEGSNQIVRYEASDDGFLIEGTKLRLYSKGDIKTIYINCTCSADLSKLTKLVSLSCHDCGLTSLDVSKCVNLEYLDCSFNSLTALDVSKNTKLHRLCCSYNNLKTIDVSKNTNLTSLDVCADGLTSLDVSKNDKLVDLSVALNHFTAFDSVKLNPDIDANALELYTDSCEIDKLPETVKAGEVLDLSKYAKCGNTKSSYEMFCYGDTSQQLSVIPETDKDFKFVFGNAYAGKNVFIYLNNDDSYTSFSGTVKVLENPDAPAAPEKPKGDVPVDDISGTITAAESTKDFDAQEILFSNEQHQYVLGEKVNKEDLSLCISPDSTGEALYDTIAKADKTFKKDTARLLAYDITLKNDKTDKIKLKDGINLTIKYPSDMAKDWNKYNFKVYHFVTFDYDHLKELDSAKIEEVKCTADKDGVHFKAPSFSNYVIAMTPKTSSAPSPKTGEANVLPNVAVLLLLFAMAGISGVYAKRKGEKEIEFEIG